MRSSKSSETSPLLPTKQVLILESHPLSSVQKTFGNIVISVVGAGVLGLPYTFMRTGWLISAIILVAVALASYYCMMLLVSSRKRLEKDGYYNVETYSDLGFHTFGRWGRAAVDTMVVLSQGGFCVAYLIFIGENLASVFGRQNHIPMLGTARDFTSHNFYLGSDYSLLNSSTPAALQSLPQYIFAHRGPGQASSMQQTPEDTLLHNFFFGGWAAKEIYIWIIFPLQLALASIRSLTHLAPFSIIADVANVLAMVVVMKEDIVLFAGTGIANVRVVDGVASLPFAIGVAIYAYEGFSLVLPLESTMKEKSKFGGVLGLAMAFITVSYVVFGLLGYFAFGEETKDIITLNLRKGWQTTIVQIALCVGLFFTFPVMMLPVHEVVERRIVNGRPSLISRALIVLVSAWLAIAVPRFGDLLSLVGSSVCCILGFVLPAIFHIKAHRGELSMSVGGLDYLLIAFGLMFAVLGTVSVLEDIMAGL